MKKIYCWVKAEWFIIHARDKVKVVLGLSKYASKKELEPFTCTDTSDLLAKTDFLPEKMKY